MVKSEFRKEALNSLRSVKSFQKYPLDKKIEKKLSSLIKSLNPKSILFYLPLGMEVNLKNLMLKEKRAGKKILVPKVENESFKMVEFRLPLEENSFNIFEPKSSSFKYKRVDLIIVPIVAMDANRKRIGFGKGMYDRFYARLKRKPIIVFIQRIPVISKEFLCDEYDIGCDFYISSKEINLGRVKNARHWTNRNRGFSRKYRDTARL